VLERDRLRPRERRDISTAPPVAASHTRAVWSLLAVTTRNPSGLNAAVTTDA